MNGLPSFLPPVPVPVPGSPGGLAGVRAGTLLPDPLPGLVGTLGQGVRVAPNGLVMVNVPRIAAILAYREQAVPALSAFLARELDTPHPRQMAVVEALFAAQKLAESGVTNAKSLYGVTSRLNLVTDPLIRVYLGGLYEKLLEEESFGSTLASLVSLGAARAHTGFATSFTHNTPAWPPAPATTRPVSLDAEESLGSAVLAMIAQKTAEETARATVREMTRVLRPELLNPDAFRPAISMLA